jgi:choline dehydrogenase-like flavoprotein
LGASVTTPAYVAAGLSMNWGENKRHLHKMNNMASFYVSTTCDSNGLVRNLPFFPGSYLVTYRVHEKALRNLSFGFSKLAKVLFAAGAVRLYPAVEGLASIADQRESERFSTEILPPAGLNLVSMHSFSSCPLGENTAVCAVDSFGKLHGYHNIYVNDASMLPTSPGVNPQGPLMALAYRNLEANFG